MFALENGRGIHDAIMRFIELMKSYNKNVNIYSKHSYERLNYHIQDSVQLASLVAGSSVHVDMGSGSGLPGIIMAICGVNKVVCVESKDKKRQFLSFVKKELSLNNLDVFKGDVQSFSSCYSGSKINSFTAKAFVKPPKLIKYLTMFKANYIEKEAICWVPVSKKQAQVLALCGEIIIKHTHGTDYFYFKIKMISLESYKECLETQYNL